MSGGSSSTGSPKPSPKRPFFYDFVSKTLDFLRLRRADRGSSHERTDLEGKGALVLSNHTTEYTCRAPGEKKFG